MKILVINGSPSGRNSITLQTVLYIQNFFPDTDFEIIHAGAQIKHMEKDFSSCAGKLKEASLLLFCYPVYTFLVPAQLHRFIELIKENNIDLTGKYATQLTTSKHFYDTTAHQFIQDNCDDLGLRYIRGLSADMEDLLHENGQEEALSFFRFVLWSMEHDCSEPVRYRKNTSGCFSSGSLPAKNSTVSDSSETCSHTSADTDSPTVEMISGSAVDGHQNPGTDQKNGRIVVVTDIPDQLNTINRPASVSKPDEISEKPANCFSEEKTPTGLFSMITLFRDTVDREVTVINLADFPFAGGCLGCFHCASDGTCVYRDGFDRFLRENIQTADAICYAFTIKDHSMGYRFKLYDDRQFCNGHRTVTMGKPVGYLVSGALDTETNLQTVIEARAQVGGNYLAGVACDQRDPASEIRQLALTLEYAIENQYQPPKNFYGVGGMKIFRDLIFQMQGLMREDHRFYKKHGFYDFPQKHKGRIAAMYLVGGMMKSKTLSKKIGSKMTEGMLLPYRKVLNKTNS